MPWRLYEDQACTQLFGGTLRYTHRQNFSDNPQDRVLYYANVDDDPLDSGSLMLLDGTNPDVDPVQMYIVDSTPGSGHEATEVRLALTAPGLGSATAGDPLDVAVRLFSGVSNAQPIHIRVENAVATLGRSTELSLRWRSRIATAAP